jgi:(1->4)-alpha-D-glucan 1-alpha-D-glucosylmutase
VGACTRLAQQLLKLTSPGVPDLYQGNETWDFSLVDPDNRRAVDYAARHAALRAIRALHDEQGAAACAQHLIEHLQDGRIKLYLTWKALAVRREPEALFRDGDYLPLKVQGARAEQVCAFARRHGGETLLVVVPRLFGALLGEHGRLPLGKPGWGDSWLELPAERMPERWVNSLTGETLATRTVGEVQGLMLAQLFRTFPYALLHAQPPDGLQQNSKGDSHE